MSLLLRRRELLQTLPSNQLVLYDGNDGVGLDAFVVSNNATSSGSSQSTSFAYESGSDIVIRSYNLASAPNAAGAAKTALTNFRTTEIVDFSGYNKLNFLVKTLYSNGGSKYYNRIIFALGTCTEANKNQRFTTISYLNPGYYLLDLGDINGTQFSLGNHLSNEKVSVDISSLSSGYICCGILAQKHKSGGSYALAVNTEISKIWLE